MKKISFLFLFVTPVLLHAEPINLGRGLVFDRVHKLPADLPASGATKKEAVILDLRYVQADAAGVAALSAWLGFRTPTMPAFVLVNADTDSQLLSALKARPAGVVSLGPALAGFTPDIALTIAPETEQKAYAALEHGATVESLITEKIDKRRYDEASLVKAHVSDTEAMPEEEESAATKAKSAPPPLIDASLQRAVQLHRALLALHKLPQG